LQQSLDFQQPNLVPVCRIRAELDSQTASLRAVLEEQNQQLKVAKEHGIHMEEQAESAQAQVGQACCVCMNMCMRISACNHLHCHHSWKNKTIQTLAASLKSRALN